MTESDPTDVANKLVVLWGLGDYEGFVETLWGNSNIDVRSLRDCDPVLRSAAYCFSPKESTMGSESQWRSEIPRGIWDRMWKAYCLCIPPEGRHV